MNTSVTTDSEEGERMLSSSSYEVIVSCAQCSYLHLSRFFLETL